MRRAAAVLVGCVLGLVLAAGCVPASPDDDTYEDVAASSLGAALSEVATVQQLLELLDTDKIMRPAVVAQLRYSEKGLDSASRRFESLNPPPAEDVLHREVSTVLQKAADQLHEAREAVERDQPSRYAPLAQELDALATRLDRLEKSAQ